MISKFPTRIAFKKAHISEYAYAQKYGLLNDVMKNIPKQDRTKWTYECIKEVAKLTSSRSEFKLLNQSAYHQARRMGWLNDVCSHMTVKRGGKIGPRN